MVNLNEQKIENHKKMGNEVKVQENTLKVYVPRNCDVFIFEDKLKSLEKKDLTEIVKYHLLF